MLWKALGGFRSLWELWKALKGFGQFFGSFGRLCEALIKLVMSLTGFVDQSFGRLWEVVGR